MSDIDTNEEDDASIEVVDENPSAADLLPVGDLAADASTDDEADASALDLPVGDLPVGAHAAPEAEEIAEAASEEAAESTAEVAPELADVDLSADVADEDELLEEEPPVKIESPFDRPGRWYVVHTQSGHEKKAQQNLAARTESMNMEERIYESVIPMEDVVEFRNGKKVVVQKKMFPGYLLVRAELDDDAWYVIRNTPSVVNFVGSGGKPSPLIRREVENFLQVKEEGAPATPSKRSKARLEYEMGETVRVKEGPFADFSGEIVEINEDQLKVKVLVNIFGRETPVELEFSQVARL
ncbi:MAG: transcription termination/antitermination protein NusG [Acidimicrobiales bacterium]